MANRREPDDDSQEAPKTTVTIHLYEKEVHNEEGSIITLHVTQTFPTKLTTFADVDDYHIIFFNSLILRCPSMQLMLHTMLPQTAFETLAPILSRARPGDIYTDKQRLYACVSRSKESTMEESVVYRMIARLMEWAREYVEPPRKFYYLANNCSKWNPMIFADLFEGTGFTLVRHLVSQKSGLYSPADPGFHVRCGRGVIKSRTQPAKIRGEIYKEPLCTKVHRTKRLHGCREPEELVTEEASSGHVESGPSENLSQQESRREPENRPSQAHRSQQESRREQSPPIVIRGAAPLAASTPLRPQVANPTIQSSGPPPFTEPQLREMAKQVAEFLSQQLPTTKVVMDMLSQPAPDRSVDRNRNEPATSKVQSGREKARGKEKQVAAPRFKSSVPSKPARQKQTKEQAKEELMTAITLSRANLINRQLPRQDGEGPSSENIAPSKVQPKPAVEQEEIRTIFDLSTEDEDSSDTSSCTITENNPCDDNLVTDNDGEHEEDDAQHGLDDSMFQDSQVISCGNPFGKDNGPGTSINLGETNQPIIAEAEHRMEQGPSPFEPTQEETITLLRTVEAWSKCVKDPKNMTKKERLGALAVIKATMADIRKCRREQITPEPSQPAESESAYPTASLILAQTIPETVAEQNAAETVEAVPEAMTRSSQQNYVPVLVGAITRPLAGTGHAVRDSPDGAAFNTRSQKYKRTQNTEEKLRAALKLKKARRETESEE